MKGELKKLKIIAYRDNKFTQIVGDGVFSSLLNPEKYAFKYKVEYTEAQGQGTSATQPKFVLFSPEGVPLRAVVTASFKGVVEDSLRVARENNNSPDLTHVRIVKEGDTLPLMTFKIYGDSKYYLQVAAANNLTNFRRLQPGQQIIFPPIEKVS